MKIHGWAYAKDRKALKEHCEASHGRSETGKFFGAVYAVRFDVNHPLSLIKIGASCMPFERIYNFGPRGKLYCISPICTNYFEIEGQLHDYFARYRVPGRTSASQPEYFNMSIPFFLSHLPELNFKKE